MMLLIVMEYNAEHSGEKYREIACAMNVADADEMRQEEHRATAVQAVKNPLQMLKFLQNWKR